MTRHLRSTALALPALVGVAFAQVALATEIPGVLPIQGRLTNADGVPVTEAELSFRLIDDDGNELYADTPAVDFDDNGFFTAYLGEEGGLDLALFSEHPGVRVEVIVAGDDTALGPFELGSAPSAGFAYIAEEAATLGGLSAEDYLTVDYAPSWSEFVGLDAAAGWGLSAPEVAGGALSVDSTLLDTVFAKDTDVAAALADKRSTTDPIDWSEIDATSIPSDIFDGDPDTLYYADETSIGARNT